MEKEEDLYRLLGGIGALAFVLEGVVHPVTIAAHVLLFLVFRKFAQPRDSPLWFAAAGAASILTSTLLAITPRETPPRPLPLREGGRLYRGGGLAHLRVALLEYS
jgi:hypothetical protein